MPGVLRRTMYYHYDQRNGHKCFIPSQWCSVVTTQGTMLEQNQLYPASRQYDNYPEFSWDVGLDDGYQINDWQNTDFRSIDVMSDQDEDGNYKLVNGGRGIPQQGI